MLLIFLVGSFFCSPLFSMEVAAAEELPHTARSYVLKQAHRYNNHLLHCTHVDLKRLDSRLWSILVSDEVCKKGSKRSLAWISQRVDVMTEEVKSVSDSLASLQEASKLYWEVYSDGGDDAAFAEWFNGQTFHENINEFDNHIRAQNRRCAFLNKRIKLLDELYQSTRLKMKISTILF